MSDSSTLLDRLSNICVAPGKVHWIKNNGDRVLLYECGHPFDREKISLFKRRSSSLEIETFASERFIFEGIDHLRKLKNKSLGGPVFEKEKIQIRNDIMKWIKNSYWSGNEEKSLLDLVVACQEVFYVIPDTLTARIMGQSPALYMRASKIAAVVTLMAVSVGYLDFRFLRDLYNSCYFMDFSLTARGLSLDLMKALEKEREESGEGQTWLKKNGTGEFDVFANHTESKELTEIVENIVINKKIFKSILRHHEAINGKGFPHGLKGGELTDLECIIILIHQKIPFTDQDYEKNDGTAFFRNIIPEDEDVKSLLGYRVGRMITKAFSMIEDENENYIEIGGL